MAGPARLDRLERVTDLVLVLLNTDQPLTLDAIALQVPGYPRSMRRGARRSSATSGCCATRASRCGRSACPGDEQYGYRIDRDAFYLPDLALEPDEQVALHLAVAGVHLGDPSGRDALLKLGATGLGEVRPIATLVTPRRPRGPLRSGAHPGRGLVRVPPDGRGASLRPALWFRFGHWYLVAWDLDREAVRTFRVDRIEDAVALGARRRRRRCPRASTSGRRCPTSPGGPKARTMSSPASAWTPWRGRGSPRRSGATGWRAATTTGRSSSRLRVAGFPALRSWILGLLDHAEILEPPEFRAELVAWLAAIARRRRGPPRCEAQGGGLAAAGRPRPERRRAAVPSRTGDEPAPAPAAGRGRMAGPGGRGAHRRRGPALQHGRGRARSASSSWRRAAVSRRTRPDTLMEIEVSETSVRAFLPPEFARPRRLTPAEGFAVAASARLIWPCPGPTTGPCGGALAKLEAALGSREAIGVDVDAPAFPGRRPPGRAKPARPWRSTTTRHRATSRRPGSSNRCRSITTDGHWYLDAFCHRAGDMRRFRVDRIGAVRPHGEDRAVATSRRAARRPRRPSFPVPAPWRCSCTWARGRSGCPSRCPCGRWPLGRRGGDRCRARCRRHGLVRTAAPAARPRAPAWCAHLN